MAKRIESSRLVLVPLAKDHLPDFHRVWSDPQATFWSLRGRTTNLEESEILILDALNDPDRPDRLSWGVYLRSNPDTCVGIVQLKVKQKWEPGSEEVGNVWVVAYMFLPEHWGKGYATESVGAMIDGVQQAVSPCTLQAYINPANPPSARVIDKLRFELVEKIYRPEEPRVFVGGEWREFDVWRYTRKI